LINHTKKSHSAVKSLVIVLALVAIVATGTWYFGQKSGGPPGRPRGFGPVLVVAEPIERRQVARVIEALGTARANESVTLTANLTDTVRRVNFDDGDYVEAGTVLVELTNVEEEAQLAEARANFDEAQRQQRRLEDLDEKGIAAASDVDAARSAAKAAEARLNTVIARLEDRLIRAPFSGVLGFREVSPGTLIRPGDSMTTLDDIRQIKLDFTVPETVLGEMQPGRKILARSAGTGDREFAGTVKVVGSRVDPVTRAAVVRAVIDNADGALRPGMLLTVGVVTDERVALVALERSVVQSGDTAFVYVVDAKRRVSRRNVDLGLRQAGTVEIVAGLDEGEMIVTEGVIKMRPGLQVRFAADAGGSQLAETGGPPGARGAKGGADGSGPSQRR
jgi:membrane fusion protein (multidrug efflux system)